MSRHIKLKIINFYYLIDQEIIVSTTRPETILGDVAIAINPDDVRYKGLNCVKLWHPFRKCTIPIIYDHSVDKEFGTGILLLLF